MSKPDIPEMRTWPRNLSTAQGGGLCRHHSMVGYRHHSITLRTLSEAYPFNIEGIALDQDYGIHTTYPNGNCRHDLRKFQGEGKKLFSFIAAVAI